MATWRTMVEFEFEVPDEVTKPTHEGDAPIDFASRAFQVLRGRLNKSFPGDDGVHWMAIPPGRAAGRKCVCISVKGAPHVKVAFCKKPVI